jgi:hypothetical protein
LYEISRIHEELSDSQKEEFEAPCFLISKNIKSYGNQNRLEVRQGDIWKRIENTVVNLHTCGQIKAHIYIYTYQCSLVH